MQCVVIMEEPIAHVTFSWTVSSHVRSQTAECITVEQEGLTSYEQFLR